MPRIVPATGLVGNGWLPILVANLLFQLFHRDLTAPQLFYLLLFRAELLRLAGTFYEAQTVMRGGRNRVPPTKIHDQIPLLRKHLNPRRSVRLGQKHALLAIKRSVQINRPCGIGRPVGKCLQIVHRDRSHRLTVTRDCQQRSPIYMLINSNYAGDQARHDDNGNQFPV